MVTLAPRPPHQWHFDAEAVRDAKGHVIGLNVIVGGRKIYLDLPKEEEIKLEQAITDIEQLPAVLPYPIGPKPTLAKRVKKALLG